ncbi:hypothetical protein ACFQAS_11475 [Halopenitus salinus]|uniref:DUF3068 domain-containing protein n=1 Tax=Halopenitus salinus TaxID=1198295 RepID=A0ABD5UZ27_9EURY
MQRRAVTVYVALLLVVGAAAGGLVATADSPEVSFEDPAYEGGAGGSFDHAGQTYTVADVTENVEEGGHGSETVTLSGTLEWNETVTESAEWANNSTVTYEEDEWRVVIEGEDPSAFTLQEVLDRQAILENDSAADNQTYMRNGEEHVAVTDEDGETTLVPADEYFPEPEERRIDEGETITYDGHDAAVANVSASAAVLEWETTQTMSAELTPQGQVTLGNTTFVAIFPDSSTVVLSSNLESYEAQQAEIGQFEQRMSGLTRIGWTIGATVLMLIAFAFVPSRY